MQNILFKSFKVFSCWHLKLVYLWHFHSELDAWISLSEVYDGGKHIESLLDFNKWKNCYPKYTDFFHVCFLCHMKNPGNNTSGQKQTATSDIWIGDFQIHVSNWGCKCQRGLDCSCLCLLCRLLGQTDHLVTHVDRDTVETPWFKNSQLSCQHHGHSVGRLPPQGEVKFSKGRHLKFKNTKCFREKICICKELKRRKTMVRHKGKYLKLNGSSQKSNTSHTSKLRKEPLVAIAARIGWCRARQPQDERTRATSSNN